MNTWNVDRAATTLLAAEDSRTGREPLTGEWPGLDLATAYSVQDETLRRRLDRGERLIGVKLRAWRAAAGARVHLGNDRAVVGRDGVKHRPVAKAHPPPRR